MSATTTVTTSPRAHQLRVLERRFDQQALEQLRTEVSRLAAENDELRALKDQLREALAEEQYQSDLWRKDALDFQLQLCERTGGQPGIDINGHLRIVAG